MRTLYYLLIIAGFLVACKATPSEGAIQTAIAETEAAKPGEAQPEPVDVEPVGEEGKAATATAEPPTSTPIETLTPTPSVVDWFLSEVEVVSFYLFEAGEDPSNAANHNYANTFTQSEARVIYGDVNLEHPSPDGDMAFEMVAIYYGPGGDAYGEVSIEPIIEPGWTMSNWIVGFGWDDPGYWDAGNYQVDVLVGESVIASDYFEIIQFTPTPEPTLTPTPSPGAVVDTNSINIRSGPDTVYGISGSASRGDLLEILGQAYNCAWLKIRTVNGIEGWVSSELVIFELSCSEIPSAVIPPTPIPLPTSTPTKQAPQGKTVSIKIVNNTGGNLSINLSGPASYSFNFPAGNHTMQVLPGTYTYTVWGCGTSASGTQKLSKGFEWTWYCN
jgi:hypothetical protein